jgi:hypothetical protein
MSIITSQQLSRYLELYGTTEVTFNKQVIDATGLIPKHVFLKIADQQWPCIVYSSSMAGARVIAGVKSEFYEFLRQANNHAALRYCFKLAEKADPISFSVASKVTGYTQYNPKNPDVQLIAIEFTQRPPDDLIQVLGLLLEANVNAQRRKDERIVLTPESLKKLGLESKESFVYVEGVPRKCIVRDLSFGGAKVLVPGIAKFLANKKASLKLVRSDSSDEVTVPGEIMRVENVEGRKDIVVIALCFSGEPPVSYKLMVNNYLTGVRKGSDSHGAEASAARESAGRPASKPPAASADVPPRTPSSPAPTSHDKS